MKKTITALAFVATLLALLVSCNGNGRKKALLPNISGKAGEVIIVINKGDWEGSLGSELRELLASDCPFLPQREPLYTLVNIAPAAFTNLFKIHRNIIYVDIDNNVTESGVVYKNDIWARPQCVIAINADNSETALQLVKDNSQMILNTLEQAERDRVIGNSKKYEETTLRTVVNAAFGGSPYFPSGYVLKKNTGDFIWIAYETTYTNQGVFIYRYPATGTEDDFKIENMVAKRDEILKANVPGMFDNTYMVTSNITTPSLEFIKYNGREFAQMRGFWEVYNDYMGGPFVSHSFYSEDGKDMIVVEAFVYAPRYDKRHYLRQVESIIYSFEWKDNQRKR